VKRILILTAGYGEGHNAAARGIRDALLRLAPSLQVEYHDLFAETYGAVHEIVRRGYLQLINHWPRSWGSVYRWLDRKTSSDFNKDFDRLLSPVKNKLALLLLRFQPDAVVSTYPPYPYLLEQISPNRTCKNIVVVTDSITVNAIWYRCAADYFLLPNEQSTPPLRAAGIAPEKIKTFGFPVNPVFADLAGTRPAPSREAGRRVLYMINAGTRQAGDLVRQLVDLDIDLTVTVGRDRKLQRTIETAAQGKATVIGWTDELPRLLGTSHLLIGKAGGATVQETIAAGCPMIINHVVSGQEEGNAQLIAQTKSGVIAPSPAEVMAQVQRAFADNAQQWQEWANNIAKLSRPRAALDIAEFLIGL
jgi:processive 1,2-diacylglycerol beta-glucosyltransferase